MQYELVKVIDRARLLDAEQMRRIYVTRDGRPLAPGIHVAFHTSGARRAVYDSSVHFRGPFPSWRAARSFAEVWIASHGSAASETTTPAQGEAVTS